MTITLEHEAVAALRVMAPGPRALGRFLSQLVMLEVQRREDRARDPAAYAQMLAEPVEAGDSVLATTI